MTVVHTIDPNEPIPESLIKQISNDVDQCKLRGLRTEPFIAGPTMELIPIVCRVASGGQQVHTAAVSGRRLYINPEFYMSNIKIYRITIVMHEAWHIALAHHIRRGTRDPFIWNVACDFHINLILLEAGFEAVPGWYFDDKYTGWSEEKIYDHLIEHPEDVPSDAGEGDPADGDSQGDGQGPTKVVLTNKDIDPEDAVDLNGKDIEVVGIELDDDDDDDDEGDSDSDSKSISDGDGVNSESTGSGSEDDDGDDEDSSGRDPEPTPDEGEGNQKDIHADLFIPTGEVWDAEDEDGNELDEQGMKDEMHRIKEELHMSKNMESVLSSGSSEKVQANRTVDRLLTPRANWENIVSKFFSRTGTPSGRSWSSLDRRGMQIGVYNPAVVRHSIDWMVFLWDVSISMDWRSHRALLSHVDRIRKTTHISRISMVPFNARVLKSEILEIKSNDPLPTEFKIGGGTDFACGFEWVREQKGSPEGIMVFTDLGDENYGPRPKEPVLWVSSEPVYDKDQWGNCNRPPFGQVVEIDLHR